MSLLWQNPKAKPNPLSPKLKAKKHNLFLFLICLYPQEFLPKRNLQKYDLFGLVNSYVPRVPIDQPR